MAAGCDGRADAGLRVDSCGNDGDGGRVHGVALPYVVRSQPLRAWGGGDHRCGYGDLAASIGMVQHDIKRVLAYSTISQLGYMFLGCGVAAYSAAVFHLVTHAFFKALLFLAAGSVIHALSGEQDMRVMGGLRRRIPVTFWTMTMGVFAIAGFRSSRDFSQRTRFSTGRSRPRQIPSASCSGLSVC